MVGMQYPFPCKLTGIAHPARCDPTQIKDKNGKDVVSLIEDLRQRMPLNLSTIMQRLKLEEVRVCM